ncbi:MAG: N-6 DNA methylase [Sulfurimonas sp.]
MAIFTASILKSTTQDESLVAKRWAAYQNFLAKTEFIKTVKEEKYQDGFLHDIFEECLGYTLDNTNPQNFNLEREKKNETDGKKADGVIYVNGEVLGIVELKDQKSKNLDAVEAQAFNYHASHSNSKYIIISNFDELRFYIDKKTAYEKFNLFYLTYDEFKKLHLLLSYESIKDALPLKLKEKSANFELQISKELYRDFSIFRNHLFENIVKNNYSGSGTLVPPNMSEAKASLPMEKSHLLRLTQKLCDRIIFILFAEDRGLLRHNTIKEIREEFRAQKFTSYTLYDIYKFYFNAINEGNEKLGIPKYNGGLFANDELLDSLIIEDIHLDMEAQKLSDYDFMSDVGVNILGHIFEQSLTDLEEMERSFGTDTSVSDKNGVKTPSPISKRKKDGVFYTPEYITRYIVENTLGRLCEEKKKEIFGSEALASPTNTKKLTKAEQAHKQNILDYREWLTNLKILDPACGSGAFLNQALEFLIKEHTLVRDMLLPFEDLTLGYEIEKEILEHNLYGVDINEDAVEIAKLSLWLRTAHKGRELTSLAEKIVCANSLLAMPFVVGSEASASPQENAGLKSHFRIDGGFDVVIGNPPYGAKLESNEQKNYEIQSKESAILFMQLSHKLLKPNGIHSFIIPKPFIFSSTWESMRIKFFDEISNIVDCSKVWDEVKLEQVIYTLTKNKKFESYDNLVLQKGEFLHIANIEKDICDKFGFFVNGVSQNEIDLALKIQKDKVSLFEISDCNWGDTFFQDIKDSGNVKVLAGANIQKYELRDIKGFISNNVKLSKNAFLRENSVLLQRLIAHIQNPIDHIKITGTILDNINEFLIVNTIQQITPKNGFSNRYILSIFHSNLMNWYIYRFVFAKAIRTFQFSNDVIKKIPIPKISETEQQPFIKLVDEILEAKQKIKEYKALLDEAVKTDNFDREIKLKKEIETLENRTKECEKTIDEMVYKLYDLSEDEIRIVEGKE